MQEPKSRQLEAERARLAAAIQTAKPGDMQKLAVEITLASLAAQIAILAAIERNALY